MLKAALFKLASRQTSVLLTPSAARLSASAAVRQEQPTTQQTAKVTPVLDAAATGAAAHAAQQPKTSGATHRPTAMDRKYLVWSGKYKSEADIPEYVHPGEMERANSKTRIRVSNILMALTAVGCIIAILSGKKAAERGESVQKRNLDWHKQYNESQDPKK